MPNWVNRNTGRTAAWLTIATVLVAAFEGYSGHAYYDVVGVETICYGQTVDDGANFSKVYTKAECLQMLGRDLTKYAVMVHGCIKGSTLPPHREAALVSFVYNLGQHALCSGAVARNLNNGNVQAGCRAMLRYDHAAGKDTCRAYTATPSRRTTLFEERLMLGQLQVLTAGLWTDFLAGCDRRRYCAFAFSVGVFQSSW